MKQGSQSWVFTNCPVIVGAAVAAARGGQRPSRRISTCSTMICFSVRNLEKPRKTSGRSLRTRCAKANLQKQDIEFFIGGDLLNQIISSTFTGRTLSVPYLGVFGACSTSMESLALGALIVDSRFGGNVLAVPPAIMPPLKNSIAILRSTDPKKPDTAQWTVTEPEP